MVTITDHTDDCSYNNWISSKQQGEGRMLKIAAFCVTVLFTSEVLSCHCELTLILS